MMISTSNAHARAKSSIEPPGPARAQNATRAGGRGGRRAGHTRRIEYYSASLWLAMACSDWCGMPALPMKALHCGVIVYLHIPKTGGSSVTQFLLQHATGGRGWWQASVTQDSTWGSIVSKVYERQRPKQVIIHHVDSPLAFARRDLVSAVIKPLDCWLRSQGCRLVLTTTLREASARAASAAFYNRVPHAQYSKWIDDHASNGMIGFLLHNRVRVVHNHSTVAMGALDLQHARYLLSDFDAIGRTEELGAFMTYLHTLIVGPPQELTNRSSTTHHTNDTPNSQKFELTNEERKWTQSRTMLDAELYSSLCGGDRCSLAQLRAGQRWGKRLPDLTQLHSSGVGLRCGTVSRMSESTSGSAAVSGAAGALRRVTYDE